MVCSQWHVLELDRLIVGFRAQKGIHKWKGAHLHWCTSSPTEAWSGRNLLIKKWNMINIVWAIYSYQFRYNFIDDDPLGVGEYSKYCHIYYTNGQQEICLFCQCYMQIKLYAPNGIHNHMAFVSLYILCSEINFREFIWLSVF